MSQGFWTGTWDRSWGQQWGRSWPGKGNQGQLGQGAGAGVLQHTDLRLCRSPALSLPQDCFLLSLTVWLNTHALRDTCSPERCPGVSVLKRSQEEKISSSTINTCFSPSSFVSSLSQGSITTKNRGQGQQTNLLKLSSIPRSTLVMLPGCSQPLQGWAAGGDTLGLIWRSARGHRRYPGLSLAHRNIPSPRAEELPPAVFLGQTPPASGAQPAAPAEAGQGGTRDGASQTSRMRSAGLIHNRHVINWGFASSAACREPAELLTSPLVP